MAASEDRKGNLALIGMPGAGKTTLGRWLADRLGRPFLDTDTLIAEGAGRSLQAIIDAQGPAALLAREEAVLAGLAVTGAVIATGGSVVYSEKAMRHLRAIAYVVHLEADLGSLERRLSDYTERGIVRRPGQSLEALLDERSRLYRLYADVSIDTGGRKIADIGEQMLAIAANCA